MEIIIINGPNLNLLGKREPGIYGNRSFDEFLQKLRHDLMQVEIDYHRSSIESELIDKLQEVGLSYGGIVLNASAYTHTNIVLLDCIRSLTTPVIEVHISNVHTRGKFRHESTISSTCLGVIAGFRLSSYKLAIGAVTGWLISVQVHELIS